MKKPAAPSPPPGTTPPTTDGKAAAKEAPPPLSPEEAFAYGAFPQPPSFKDMLGSGGMYAEAGTFDQYVKRGKRLLTVFGSLPTLREGQPSVGAWRLQRREYVAPARLLASRASCCLEPGKRAQTASDAPETRSETQA